MKKNTFVGKTVKTISAGMAHILYNKGKIITIVPAGKIGKGVAISKDNTAAWGKTWKDAVDTAKKTYGKIEYRYAVNL